MATKTRQADAKTRRAVQKNGRTASGRPSAHPGMGAVCFDGGVAFRVWAPFAEAVFVKGTFNDWALHPLAREEGGYWSADAASARPGDEYKFVIRSGGALFDRNDPYARQVVNSAGNAVVYDPAFDWEGDEFTMPPWNELVLYELHVGTFHDENDAGPGDLHSSIQRLDYLRDLGVNAVELMPLAEFAGDFSWGYNPAHPFAVESAYGGPHALKRFVKEAHRRGLGVLLDVVYNHFGPADLDLWRFDGWHEGDWGGIYFYNDPRAETPWGKTRPDYGRAEVRRYIRDNVFTWLAEFHLDGLRWDGTVFIRNRSFSLEEEIPDGWRLMQEINREVHEQLPGKIMIAEDLQKDAALTAPVERQGAGFDMQWDAAFVHPIRAALIPPRDEARDVGAVCDALAHRYNEDAFRRIIYTESHDEVANGCARVPYEIDPEHPESWASQKRSTLGAALVFTAPGVPMLFQGQEFLEDEWFCDTDPVDWRRLEEEAGIHTLYRDLIALRRNLRGTTRGLSGQHLQIFHVNPEEKLIAFRRWMEGGPRDETVIVANLANRAHESYRLGFPRAGRWEVRFNSDWDGYCPLFSNHPAFGIDAAPEPLHDLPAQGALSIGPYTALILSQEA